MHENEALKRDVVEILEITRLRPTTEGERRGRSILMRANIRRAICLSEEPPASPIFDAYGQGLGQREARQIVETQNR